jgi:cytochrome c oxidase subunit 2
MIPGRESTIEFRADHPGTFRGKCAEFCGLEHALMAFSVVAEPPAQYQAWVAHQQMPAPQPANDLQAQGERIFTTGACAGCHTVRGTSAHGVLGPDLTHVKSRPMLAAGTFANNTANLDAWIKAPGKHEAGHDDARELFITAGTRSARRMDRNPSMSDRQSASDDT